MLFGASPSGGSAALLVRVSRGFAAEPPEAPESVVINGEQLHRATGIASETCCSAGAAAAVRLGAGGAGVAAPASLRSASRRRDGTRTIVRMPPITSSPAETPKAIV